MQTLKARVSMVLFPRPGMKSSNGWVKLLVRVKGMNDFAATGMIKDSERNISLQKKTITLTGDWDKDPKFCGNFKCTSIDVIAADTTQDILVNICKVSKSAAAEIDARYGDNITDVLNNKSYLLLDIKGVTTKKLEKLIHNWRTFQRLSALNQLLLPLAVSDNMKLRIAKHFGSDAVDKITADPYVIIAVPGITFQKVDSFALALGVPAISQRRARAAALWSFNIKARDCGNTAISSIQLIEAAEIIAPEIDPVHFRIALKYLVDTDQVVDFKDGSFASGQLFDIEYQVKESFLHRAHTKKNRRHPLLSPDEVDLYIQRKSAEMGFPFSDEQIRAIRIAAGGDMTFAICGYAGTGKSTISKAILDLYMEVCYARHAPLPRILCLALSGVAADRIRQVSGFPASTIHSALGWVPGEDEEPGTFKHNKFDPLEYDVILLDECSMIDSSIFRDLLDAIAPATRLILLGDDAQLAPIGAGDVFRDVLVSGMIPVVILDEIFRNSKGSVIPIFADQVRKGLVPADYMGEYDDFRFDAVNGAEAIVERIIALSMEAKEWISDPIRDFQVLSPMVISPLGAKVLNGKLQTVFNPPSDSSPAMMVDNVRYQLGDKVVHLKNAPMTFMPIETFEARGHSKGVKSGDEEEEKTMRICNGFIGVVCHVSEGGGSLCVRYPNGSGDIVVEYTRALAFSFLGLAYCLSVHKFQGSEAKMVVLPIHSMAARMLNNRWLYTAVTRGKSKVILVGQPQMFERACLTMDESRRSTVLQRLVGVHEIQKIEVDVPVPAVGNFRGWRMPTEL